MQERIPPEKARQGSRGTQILFVLVGGLILAAAAWWVSEIYGESIDSPPADAQTLPSETPAPAAPAPAPAPATPPASGG